MKKKLVGIFVCMMMLTTCVVPVMGELIPFKKTTNNTNPTDSGNSTLKFMIAGNALRALRSYWLHVPPSYDESKPTPLVIVFHPGYVYDSNDSFWIFRSCWIENYTKFSEKADNEGFIVVYPNSKLLIYDPLQTPIFDVKNLYNYNFGWIPSLGRYYTDDIGFTRDIIDKMKRQYTINSSRIYVTGLSVGAMMTYSTGAYLSDTVAAIAPVAGTIGGRANESQPFSYIPAPEHPVSVIAFHGAVDQTIPYKGNKNLVSVKESISFWVEHNGCNPTPEINISEDGKVNRTTYTNGENGVEVVFYYLRGVGHWWPGNPYNPNDKISATDLIWEFFEAHPKQ